MKKELNEIFEGILEFAERNQKCLRKAVGCAAIFFSVTKFEVAVLVHNGPSREGHECTNEVGNCGCSHSEPRLVQQVLARQLDMPLILVCSYSPCTTCANIVIDSKLFSGVIYDVLTQHDKRGEKFLRDAMPVLSREVIETMTEEEVSDKLKKWISD